uniref:Uncharacterized protein n=1 Tax=Avena sativa TaxID=4498 RepID=A0ACD5TJG1_AVESA
MAANVMLAIHEKKATAVDLYRPLRQYIASTYSEREAATADDDLCAVRDLRAAAVESPSLPDASSLEQRRDTLLAYARALALVEPRFPISNDRAHVYSLSFTWHDAFKTNKKVNLPSIHLERAAVLFNLGAVYSQIALAADRVTDVGIRTACGAFQSAAGAFALLRESGVAAKAVAAGATTVDVTPDCAGMLEKLMLAQAQECFFEKVIAGGKPPTLCSKVARQVGVYYEEAYAALCAPPLSQHFDKTWVSHVQLKAAQFYADACYRCSLDLHQQEEIAQEIARLKIGMSNISIPSDLKEDVEAVQISGGPAGLEAELQQLRDLSRVNQDLLVQTEEMLQKEASEDAQFRTQFGSRWTRPQSSTLTKNIQDRLNLFAANLKKAAGSDALIERGVKENYPLMSILDRRPIESALPSISRPIMSLDGNEDAIVGALKQSLRQLQSLGEERAGLEDMLKEMKRKDDILPKLMAGVGSHDDLFKKEIAKYDQICAEIADNIVAQEHLLLQIQAQNEQFAAVFNLDDFKVARERCYKQIAAAVVKYQETKKNLNDGLNFYVTLQVTPNQRLDLLTHSHTPHTAHHRNNLHTARHLNNPHTARHLNNLHTARHHNILHTAHQRTLVSTSSRRISHLLAMTMANRRILDGAGRTTMGSSHSHSNQGRIHKHHTMPQVLTLLTTRVTTTGLSETPPCSAATIWFLPFYPVDLVLADYILVYTWGE